MATNALTRIRNNQVYNNDINAQYKITTKTIVGGLLADNFTYTGNMTIGNLTVNGQTTTVDTTNLVIADPLLAINRNQSGTPTYDLGFVMGRGNQNNVAMIWEENSQQFQLQYTTESTSATTYGQINNSGFANLQAYGVSLNNATIGTASLTTLNTGTITATGNIWADSGTASTTPTTGALVVTGGIGVSGAIVANGGIALQGNNVIHSDSTSVVLFNSSPTSSLSAFQAVTAAIIGANTGTWTIRNATLVGNNATQNLYNTVATTMNFAGAATSLNMGNTSGTATIANPTLVGSQTTQNLYNTVATTLNFGGATTSLVMGAATGTATINNPILALTNGTQLLINGSNPVIDTSNTGTASLFNANATTVNIGGAATTVSIGASTGRTSINNDASADNFIVNGSAGQFIGNVQGAIGANVPNIGIFTNITATNAIHGNLSAGNINGYLNGALGANIPNTVVATSVTTTNGGQHVGYFTGAIGANTSNSGVFTTVSASTVNAGTIGNSGAVLTASTATITGTANSYAAGQGALQITGGFYAGGDSYIAGNLIVSNLQAVQQTILSIQDPLLYLQNQGIGTYNYDIGFYGHFIGGNNNNYQHTGLVRNYIDNDWYLFSNAPEPSGNVIAFGSNTVYDTLKLGALLVQNTTTSSSSTTGALQVAGGAGIAGSLYAGSIQNTPIGSITPSTGVFTTANINGTLYAATINAGAIGNTNTTFSGASLTVTGSVTAGSFIGNSNGNISGYLNGALGANVPNTVVATSVITSSGGQHIGYFTGAIGANTPNTGVFTTASTSGNLTVGGNLTVTGNLNAVTANVYTQGGIFYGAPGTGMNALYAGLSSYTPLSNVIAQFSANVNNFAQINSQNANAGAQASTDFIATANNGSDNDTYIDMGINSSGYNQAAFSITQANDGYLYVAGNTTTGGGNLVFSTTTLNDIVFSLAGTTAANEFARMRANTNSFVISSTTTSTSNTTGALQVRGGTGITGNIYSGANIYATTAMSSPSAYRNNLYPYSGSDINYNTGTNGNLNINPNGVVANLVVNGNTAASYGNLLVVNGSTGQVGVKTPIGSFVGNASFQINSTDSIIIPVGTTSQRPSNTTTGMMRFNTQVGQIEFWNGSQWSTTAGSFTVISENTYTGDGTTTAFTLSQSSTTNATLVMINGVVQIPITAYSVSGTTLTFTEAPLSTDIIDARVITTSTTVTALTAGTSAININDSGAGTGNASTIVNNSVRYIANSGTSGSNYFNGGQAPTMGNVSLTQSTPTVIDTFSVSAFRGAKYVVKVTDGTNNVYSMAEVIIVHDGTTPTSQIYGVVNTGSNSLANFSTTLSAGSVNLLANTWSSTASATVFQTYMPL